MKKTTIIASILGASLLAGVSAEAKWVSKTKVTRVRTYTSTSSYVAEIWFADDVASGCSNNDRVRLSTSDARMFRTMVNLARTARLTQSWVEVNTKSGCTSGNGKLDYMSLK